MSEDQNGGPAFPYEHGHSPDASNVRESGMTLRDYFAAHALTALIVEYSGHPEVAATLSYHAADAMLAERAKQNPTN